MIKKKKCENKKCGKGFYATKRGRFCCNNCRLINWRKTMSKYGIFSKKMLKMEFEGGPFGDEEKSFGVIYSSPAGDVLVTAVGDKEDCGCKHEDQVSVGVVYTRLRQATIEDAYAALLDA